MREVQQYEIGSYKNFVYLILDWAQKKAAIIDPQFNLSKPLGDLKEKGFTLTAVLLTHTHFDHIAGLAGLLEAFPQLPLYVHPADLHRIKADTVKRSKLIPIQDQDIIQIGDLSVHALHTPGHSPGEVCYFLKETNPPALFTGDTVFIRDCGRTDLEGGNNAQMFHSLQRIKQLPPQTVILPGHHYQSETSSLLGDELLRSPPFQCKSVDELANLP